MRTTVLLVLVSMSWATRLDAQGPLFAPAPASPVRVGPGSGTVILADVSVDGHLDLLTRHSLGHTATVQLGDGKGGFTAAPRSPLVFAYSPGDMKLGDLNKDGILDLAVTRRRTVGGGTHSLPCSATVEEGFHRGRSCDSTLVRIGISSPSGTSTEMGISMS